MWRLLWMRGHKRTFLTIMYTSKLWIKYNYCTYNSTSLTKTVYKAMLLKRMTGNGKLCVFHSFTRLLGLPLELKCNITLQILFTNNICKKCNWDCSDGGWKQSPYKLTPKGFNVRDINSMTWSQEKIILHPN